MRIRTGLGVLICCCAGLAACTAAAPKGPDTTVTTPSVGRPPAPVSAQAALSSEALTPYFGLGAATDDGLAPGETYAALHTACMDDAGYGQYADAVPYPVRANRGMAFAQDYGPWGYLGTADAVRYGFAVPTASDPEFKNAIQASYEQQAIDANQQALGAAVREYKASYAKELSDLPALLRTTSATLNLPGPAGKAGRPGQRGTPGPTRS